MIILSIWLLIWKETHKGLSVRVIQWEKPAAGTQNWNIHGSSLRKPGLSGFGGFLRDSNVVFLIYNYVT
jgi:hypothetical protein